jgi:hypothetical protein
MRGMERGSRLRCNSIEWAELAARQIVGLRGGLRSERRLRPNRWLYAAFGLAVVIVFAMACTASATIDPRLVWSAPVLVDRGVAGTANSGGIQALSCPSVSLCVAFDDLGNLVTSTKPADVASWRVRKLPAARGLYPSGVSCPSVSLCVAAEGSNYGAGRIILSTAPANGATAWHVERVGAETAPASIACPSAALCVVGEYDGNLVTSTNPAGGAATWRAAHVDSTKTVAGDRAALLGVACPSVSLCVAVDDAGNVLSSTNPAGGSAAWKLVHPVNPAGEGNPGYAAVSCPSVSACFAIEGGMVLTSTDPTGGRSAWTATSVAASSIDVAISCPAISLCVATRDDDGSVVSSSFPTGAAGTWRPSRVDGTNELTAISCPTVTFCAIADGDGNIVVGAPTAPRIDVPQVIVRNEGTLRARRRGSRTTIDTRLVIACPRGGRTCTVTGKAIVFGPSLNSEIPIGRVHLTIKAGGHREIVLTLSRTGQRLLARGGGFLDGDLSLIARVAHARAVANDLLFSVEPPFP